jgi:hypothetical protein
LFQEGRLGHDSKPVVDRPPLDVAGTPSKPSNISRSLSRFVRNLIPGVIRRQGFRDDSGLLAEMAIYSKAGRSKKTKIVADLKVPLTLANHNAGKRGCWLVPGISFTVFSWLGKF